MKKNNIMIFGSFILATILGIFGQSIAYFMNRNIVDLAPIIYLTSLTIVSLIFYLFSLVLVTINFKKYKISKDTLSLYLLLIGLVGGLTSLWSLFVLAMWWG